MINEPETQLTLKQGDSTLILSQVRCALVTRGLRDAAILQVSPDELVPLNKSVVKRLAEEGDAEAQFDLGLIYQFAGKYATGEPVPFGISSTGENIVLEGPRDYAEAARWYRKAADQGTGHAQVSLGEMYYRGQGVQQDYFGAVYWFRRAASQGHPSALYALGRSYFNGEGVVKDYSEAIRLYAEAGEMGDLQAQMTLGSLYYGGEIVPQSFTESFKWYRKASDGLSTNAWCMVGQMYYDGTGVAQDHAEAARWFQKAAERGDARAQANLARAQYR